jgi:hypothetical protein
MLTSTQHLLLGQSNNKQSLPILFSKPKTSSLPIPIATTHRSIPHSSSSSLSPLIDVASSANSTYICMTNYEQFTMYTITNITHTAQTNTNFCSYHCSPGGHDGGSKSPQKKSRSVDDEVDPAGRRLLQQQNDLPQPPPEQQQSPSKTCKDPPLDQLILHTATDRDTLTSIAARYDCTPSEIIKLNRLSSRLIFPGQIVKVPKEQQLQQQQQHSEDQVFSEDKTIQRKFVKLNVRHITDGNVITTLLSIIFQIIS